MNLLLLLLLAHFLADYPLQSNGLVKYKQAHFLGVALHSLIHLLVSVLFVWPFIAEPKVWIALAILFVSHNLSDQLKVLLSRWTRWNGFTLYLADQFIHLMFIVALSIFYLGPMTPRLSGLMQSVYGDESILSFFLCLTLATYFYDVSRWTYLNSKKPRPYKRDYPMMGRNALIVVIGFTVYWVLR